MRRPVSAIAFAIFIVLCSLSSVYEQEREIPVAQRPVVNMSKLLVGLIDLNSDGKLSGAEYMKFFSDADQDKDGFVNQQDLVSLMDKRQREKRGQALQEEGGLDVGQKAPEFTLRRLDGEGTVKLSDYIGEKPVVLVFGSYT